MAEEEEEKASLLSFSILNVALWCSVRDSIGGFRESERETKRYDGSRTHYALLSAG